MICEGTIPEQRRPVERQVEHQNKDGSPGVKTIVEEEVIPARPCDQPATMLARSMRQVKCELLDQLPNPGDGIHWLIVEDHAYCSGHYVPGTMTHLDGRVTSHAAMAVDDA